jgi:hypothetical protein
MQRKIIILLAALVVAFMFVGAASAATPVASKTTVGVPTGNQNNPAVSAVGPKVVWEQLDANTGLTNVWVKNTATGNAAVVNQLPVNQAKPDIMGDVVTWQQIAPGSGTNTQIYVRNLTSGHWGLLATNLAEIQANARIAKNPHDGLFAVWQQSEGGFNQIYMKTIFAVGPATEVQDNDGVNQINPDASGNLVVWQQGNGLQKVWYKDLEQLDTGAIAPGVGGSQTLPRISGANVVWVAFNTIYLTNLDVFKSQPGNPNVATRALLPGAALIQQFTPDISGTFITWSQTTIGLVTPQVWVMNLATGNAKIVSTSLMGQVTPAIDGTVVAWVQQNPLFDTVYWRNVATGQHAQLA